MEQYRLIIYYWGPEERALNFAEELAHEVREPVALEKKGGRAWVKVTQVAFEEEDD